GCCGHTTSKCVCSMSIAVSSMPDGGLRPLPVGAGVPVSVALHSVPVGRCETLPDGGLLSLPVGAGVAVSVAHHHSMPVGRCEVPVGCYSAVLGAGVAVPVTGYHSMPVGAGVAVSVVANPRMSNNRVRRGALSSKSAPRLDCQSWRPTPASLPTE